MRRLSWIATLFLVVLAAKAKDILALVNTTPQGAEVWSNNVMLGTTPCQINSKDIKKKLVFKKAGYVPRTVWYKDKINSFNVQLSPASTSENIIAVLDGSNRSALSIDEGHPAVTSRIPKEQLPTPAILAQIKTSSSTTKLSPKAIYKKYSPAVFMIYTSDGEGVAQGSGFFVNSEGLAISNYHVFQGTYKGLERIKLPNGKVYNVKEVFAYSERFDYILFQVDGSGTQFPYIPITKRGYEIGDEVVAIGSPKGMENTLSNGLVSQKWENYKFQISVPIDHGSSGGALINEYGEVIGITSGGRDDSGANLNYAQDIRAIFSNGY